MGVFGQEFDGQGVKQGVEFQINSYTPATQFGAAVSHDAAGVFVVVWSSYLDMNSSYDVLAQRFGFLVATGPASGGASQAKVFQ